MDLGIVAHSIVSFSSFSIPAPGNLLADPQVASTPPRPQIDQLTPGPGFLPLSSVTAFSFTGPQLTSVSHPSKAPNGGAFDTHDNYSRAPDSFNNVVHPHQLEISIPDIAAELSRCPLDTVPSSRDTDRSE